MITPSYGLTATERVLPRLALDFTTANLDPRITFTRALNTATRVNSSGSVEVVNADVARLDYNPTTLACNGLLIEESRVNSIRNNTMAGAVAGTPGTMPTNWSFNVVTTTGLTTSVVETGAESGIEYVDLKLQGTSSGAGSFTIILEQNGVIAASNGQTWTGSVYWKIAAGGLAGISGGALRYDERAGGFLATKTLVSGTPTTAALISQRLSGSATNTNASTTNIVPYIRFSIADATAIDLTLRIGLPQLELGASPTSVIKTSSAAVTRDADVATMTGTNFSSWFNASEGTFQCIFSAPNTETTTRIAVGASDGTLANWILIGKASTNRSASEVYVTSVQASIASAAGNLVNTLGNVVFAYKQNNFANSTNGLLNGTDVSGAIPTVSQLNIGDRPTLGRQINGWIRKINYWPQRLLNSETTAFSK